MQIFLDITVTLKVAVPN